MRLAAHDDVSGVESVLFRWDGGSWKGAGDGVIAVPEASGRHEFEFRAVDRRGRWSRTWKVAVEVGGDVPEAPRIVR